MSPTIERETYAKTHSHVIYSSLIFNVEQQILKAVEHQHRYVADRHFLALESANNLPQNHVPPQTQLSGHEMINTKSIHDLFHHADDLLMDTTRNLVVSPFTRVQCIDDDAILMQYKAEHEDLVYSNFKCIHNSLLSWLHPWNGTSSKY